MQYRYVQPPRTFAEEIEDAIDRSGSNARIESRNREKRTVRLRGDYADLILARKELERIHVSVEP